ncbi:MAG: monovalent cation/H(+) antiporter subunit G [Clostridia bacterium]|nr:monovalent cation/H(+) antiporter subunit G [Clostridia bacterium]
MTSDTVRLLIGALLMAGGIAVIVVSLLGFYRFRFVLNRMHCAAIVDTLGSLLILAALMVLAGAPVYLFKLLGILAFLWVGSPVASHLVCRTELLTDQDVKKHIVISEEAEGHEHDVL